MRKISIIDLGTNTFNILICQTSNGQIIEIVYKDKIPVKLGEGGINLGFIQPKPFFRGLEAMKIYAERSKAYKVDKIYALATSAIRSSKNGSEFCKEVFESTGIEITVIDGKREAELIYKGVKLSGVLSNKASLILDIGGGSREFIIGNNKNILWKHSFDIGVSRLIQRFPHQNPITKDEIVNFENIFAKELKHLFIAIKKFKINTLVGSSGSFDTFAEMISYNKLGNDSYSHQPMIELSMIDFLENHHSLILSTIEKRKKMNGLIAMRVDMIVIASIMVNFLIRRLHISHLKVSAYSLKEGVLADLDFGNRLVE